MRTIEARNFNAATAPHDCHVVTYAEEGFAPLNIHTRHLHIGPDQLRAFADEVNRRLEPRSLHPIAPLSAVPRELIRGMPDSAKLADQIILVLQANASTFKATTLIFDFRCPSLGRHVLPAIQTALEHPSAICIRDALVLE